MKAYKEYVDEWVVRATAHLIGRDILIVTSSVSDYRTMIECQTPGEDEPLLIGQLVEGCHFISLGAYNGRVGIFPGKNLFSRKVVKSRKKTGKTRKYR